MGSVPIIVLMPNYISMKDENNEGIIIEGNGISNINQNWMIMISKFLELD